MAKLLLYLVVAMFLFIPVVFAKADTDLINQRVCNRFENDVVRMAAIMDELRYRQGITSTRVAFGGIDTPVKSADYWVNYAAEAIAYQRSQKYSSQQALRSSLEVLSGKILKAKVEVGKTLP